MSTKDWAAANSATSIRGTMVCTACRKKIAGWYRYYSNQAGYSAQHRGCSTDWRGWAKLDAQLDARAAFNARRQAAFDAFVAEFGVPDDLIEALQGGPIMNDVKYPELAGKFRKRPVVIDAWCIDYNNTPYPEWVESAFNKDETEAGAIDWCPSGEGLYINTLEGHMQAAVGDFLIRGVAGELYACRADIFAATYEAAHLADATCALRGAQKESGWQSIDSAPRDGTYYLATNGEWVTTENRPPQAYPGFWVWNPHSEKWYGGAHIDDFEATHWKPMPALPSAPTPEGEAK